jgi:large subunit ribosomal protein L17
MRHGKKIHKLNRPAEHRKALMNNLAMALITYKQIQTTDAKAKALKPFIDRLIATAQQNTLHAKRMVARSVKNKKVFKELFENVVPKLEGRTSGFSRIIKYKQRRGDGAPVSIIELMIEHEVEEKTKKKSKKAAPKQTEAKVKEAPAPEKVEEVETAPTEPETTEEQVEETKAEAVEATEPEEKGEETATEPEVKPEDEAPAEEAPEKTDEEEKKE